MGGTPKTPRQQRAVALCTPISGFSDPPTLNSFLPRRFLLGITSAQRIRGAVDSRPASIPAPAPHPHQPLPNQPPDGAADERSHDVRPETALGPGTHKISINEVNAYSNDYHGLANFQAAIDHAFVRKIDPKTDFNKDGRVDQKDLAILDHNRSAFIQDNVERLNGIYTTVTENEDGTFTLLRAGPDAKFYVSNPATGQVQIGEMLLDVWRDPDTRDMIVSLPNRDSVHFWDQVVNVQGRDFAILREKGGAFRFIDYA